MAQAEERESVNDNALDELKKRYFTQEGAKE